MVYLPCCQGSKEGEFSEDCLPNLTVQFILSPSIIVCSLFLSFAHKNRSCVKPLPGNKGGILLIYDYDCECG